MAILKDAMAAQADSRLPMTCTISEPSRLIYEWARDARVDVVEVGLHGVTTMVNNCFNLIDSIEFSVGFILDALERLLPCF